MKWRSPWAVLALTLVSAGAYAIAWLVETRKELVQLGARIPSPWLLAVPVAGIYWAWCWAEGVRLVTAGRTSAAGAFALVLLGPLGLPLVQRELNALRATGSRRPG